MAFSANTMIFDRLHVWFPELGHGPFVEHQPRSLILSYTQFGEQVWVKPVAEGGWRAPSQPANLCKRMQHCRVSIEGSRMAEDSRMAEENRWAMRFILEVVHTSYMYAYAVRKTPLQKITAHKLQIAIL